MYLVQWRFAWNAPASDELLRRVGELTPLVGAAPGCLTYFVARLPSGLASFGLYPDRSTAEHSCALVADWLKHAAGSGPPRIAAVVLAEVVDGSPPFTTVVDGGRPEPVGVLVG
ncbi:MAG: hypothetical protein HY329_27420 [Chloroflexi bacterium]|nr:hypothetical protein [Chloroflexota bacterium]